MAALWTCTLHGSDVDGAFIHTRATEKKKPENTTLMRTQSVFGSITRRIARLLLKSSASTHVEPAPSITMHTTTKRTGIPLPLLREDGTLEKKR